VVSVLGESKIYQNLVYFTRIGDFTWRVSDCEELVWVTHMRKDVACWWRWRPPLMLILLKNIL